VTTASSNHKGMGPTSLDPGGAGSISPDPRGAVSILPNLGGADSVSGRRVGLIGVRTVPNYYR
jgi:hypothetical protein